MRFSRMGWSGLLLAACLGAGTMQAQAASGTDTQQGAAEAGPQFEVATIKPSVAGACCAWWQADGRQFSVHNANLRWLIRWAYGLNNNQIVGGPAWMDDQDYDITGVIDGTKTPDDLQWKRVMQRLLLDRFQMKVHHESREMAAFVLTVAKGGPKLTKSDPAKDTEPSLAFNGGPGQTIRGHGEDVTVPQFMNEVQRIALDRPLVDRTGIAGTFDLKLEFTREENGMMGMTTLPDTAAPNLITALDEQLGLRLQSQKAPVDVLVIDQAELPSAN